jgi:hypothetical protein
MRVEIGGMMAALIVSHLGTQEHECAGGTLGNYGKIFRILGGATTTLSCPISSQADVLNCLCLTFTVCAACGTLQVARSCQSFVLAARCGR